MSTQVQSSLANLKASTAQLVGIIAGTWHIPAGSVDIHLVLTKQVTTLLADIIQAHEKWEYIPGIVASCSKKLMRALPNWHSIGHDDPWVARHAWCKQVHACEALDDNSCDLPVVPNISTGPLTVNLPSPPVPSPAPVPSPTLIIPSPLVITGPSGKMTPKVQDKGKGKATSIDLELEVGESNKRKSPMISGHFFQPPKSAMKAHKCVNSTQLSKLKPFVESEDDEDSIPISHEVPEVVLPHHSTIVVRKFQLPQSPSSPKKQAFGPALLTASSHLEVTSSGGFSQSSGGLDGDLPANTTFDITIPSPIPQNNPCHYCIKENWPCATRLDKRSSLPYLSCICCSTKKIKCNPASMGSLPKWTQGKSTTSQTRSKTPASALSNAPSPSQSRAQTRSQSCGPSQTPAIPAATTPQVQSCGHSKTITTKKTPAPVPAPVPAVRSSSIAVPHAALNVPIPDLHSMAITIWDGTACITILEAWMQKQDTKIDTLQCLHESLQHTVVDWHPSFSLLDTPADASMLLDQGGPPLSMSPLPSTLSNLIDLDFSVMEPTPLTPEHASTMVGPMVEPTQVQPEGPQSSGRIVFPDEPGNLLPEFPGDMVVPNEPGNLLPEYDSSDEEMDVERKVDLPGEEVEMAT
ncbi:hypothetical protein BDR06DRAFT_1049363 [Suillus hirtellus]|nr:hypothetical protein BDR06DRAFT_1049363 [Suillus hirtellus]